MSQIRIGDHFAGGIVFYLDSTGRHGEVLAESPSVEFSSKTFRPSIVDTMKIAGYSDWFVPSGSQLALVYQNVKKDPNRVSVCGGGTYWTSTIAASDVNDPTVKVYAVFNLTQGTGELPRTDVESSYPIRPIRKF